MTSFTRKIKRKQDLAFTKIFKKSMKKFKEMVKCSRCARTPLEGEKIDNWHIDKNTENIDLICEECYSEIEEGEKSPDENSPII